MRKFQFLFQVSPVFVLEFLSATLITDAKRIATDLEWEELSETAKQVESALREKINPEKAAFYPRFFKTGKGEYGEGDKFLGVVVPDQRKIARKFKRLPIREIEKLLDSKWHENRLTGLLILVDQFDKAQTESFQKEIYDFYLGKIDRINNWDLVDGSCHKIIGPYLYERSRKPLIRLAKAKHIWKNRIAIVTTNYFIQRNDLGTTIEISEILVDHSHDLIHKAVGWMLRELGKKNEGLMLEFLKEHPHMSRTMLRYAIEKLPKTKRDQILAGKW